jgi:2-oxoglutarate ferredoxin oxidoreductase subunit alpha
MISDVDLPDVETVAKSIVNRKVNNLATYQPYDVPNDQPAILNPFFTGSPYHISGLHHDKTGFPSEHPDVCQKLIERQFRKIDAHLDEIESFERYELDDADYLIICYGSVSLSAKTAIQRMRAEGMKVGMFRPITLWPSPSKRMYDLAKRFDPKNILVVEMNMGQYLREVERTMSNRPQFLGKANGRPISPPEIIEKIRSMHHGL